MRSLSLRSSASFCAGVGCALPAPCARRAPGPVPARRSRQCGRRASHDRRGGARRHAAPRRGGLATDRSKGGPRQAAKPRKSSLSARAAIIRAPFFARPVHGSFSRICYPASVPGRRHGGARRARSRRTNSASARSGGQAVGPTEAVRLMNQGALLVDVRTQAEFDSGHIIDARLRAAGAGRPGRRDAQAIQGQGRRSLLRERHRSGAAARVLRAQGFAKVVTLRGGLQAWRGENLPLVKGRPRTRPGRRRGMTDAVAARHRDVFDRLVPVTATARAACWSARASPSARSRSTRTPRSVT